MSKKIGICAIIIAYHPTEKFYSLLENLLKQVDKIIIVDNTENASTALPRAEEPIDFTRLYTILPGTNIGISAGLNYGIKAAKNFGFNYVLLLDQDSLPASNMVVELFNAYKDLTESGCQLAVVGPQCIDSRTKKSVPFSIRSTLTPNYQAVNYLVTSGSFIELKTFEAIGFFEEELFIDNIDIEWCARAVGFGYTCVGVNSAILYHHLGEKVVNLLGRPVHTHKPFRLYYRFRNSVLLYKKNYVSVRWKLKDSLYLCFKAVFYVVFMPQRLQSFFMMLRGFRDGIRGITGKYAGPVAIDKVTYD